MRLFLSPVQLDVRAAINDRGAENRTQILPITIVGGMHTEYSRRLQELLQRVLGFLV